MIIQEIDEFVFDKFAKNHMLKNYSQTREYGELMKMSDYEVMYIGAFYNAELIGASLILHKLIAPTIRYGYAPRGFLVDYYDSNILTLFTKKVKSFFFKKNFAFIKINPEITYATLNTEDKTKLVNKKNKELVKYMRTIGYDKLKDNLYFESLLPKYSPVIFLEDYDFEKLNPELKSKIERSNKRGLIARIADENNIEKFYEFVQEKHNKTLDYYKYFYQYFEEGECVDLILIEIDFNRYGKLLQKEYVIIESNNEIINSNFRNDIVNEELYQKKLLSDMEYNDIKHEINLVNSRMKDGVNSEIVGGALIAKTGNRVTLLIQGTDKEYIDLNVKEFLFFKIIEKYKTEGYAFLDLNGITGDFSDQNPYKKLNEFKISFNPKIFEYVGEMDLVVNKAYYQLLWSTNKLQKEFKK